MKRETKEGESRPRQEAVGKNQEAVGGAGWYSGKGEEGLGERRDSVGVRQPDHEGLGRRSGVEERGAAGPPQARPPTSAPALLFLQGHLPPSCPASPPDLGLRGLQEASVPHLLSLPSVNPEDALTQRCDLTGL